MWFIKTLSVFAIAALAFTALALAEPKQPAEPANVLVKQKWHKPPKNVKRVKKFTPTGTPSVSQVHRIAALEQARWGGPSLINRIHCESTYNWAAGNGQYRGLLQFGPIRDSMWPGTPRGVKVVSKKMSTKPIVRWRKWSKLGWIKKKKGSRKQTVWTVRKGKLPAYPSPYHGWAAIRVGQRAVSGHGPTTGWECGL